MKFYCLLPPATNPLLCSVLLLLGCCCANALSPGPSPAEMVIRWREEAISRGRSARAVLDDPRVAQIIWQFMVDDVEGVRRGGSDPPEVDAANKLAEQLKPGDNEETYAKIDELLKSVEGRTAFSGQWHLNRLSATLRELVSLDDDRVMNLIGPLFAEASRISPEFDSPAPSVRLQAVLAAKELSKRGILPKETEQLKDPDQWKSWWTKHKQNYEVHDILKQIFGSFELPPNKEAEASVK